MGIWEENFSPRVLLSWEVVGWTVPIVLAAAAIVLIFDQYLLSNICFVLIAVLLFSKTIYLAAFHKDRMSSLIFAFVISGLIGLCLVVTVRGVNHFQDKKALDVKHKPDEALNSPSAGHKEKSEAPKNDVPIPTNDKSNSSAQPKPATSSTTKNANNPPKVGAQSTFEPRAPSPPPIQDVRIVSQEWISSTDPKYQYDLKVIVQTNVTISPVSFVFEFDQPISIGKWNFADGGPGMIFENWSQVQGNPHYYLFAFRSPSFSPEQNVILHFFSNDPIHVVNFFERPFPTAKDLRPQ